MDVRAGLDRATEQRPASPGRPQDGPYPATIDEVADEVVAWLRDMDETAARGLVGAVFLRLDERRTPIGGA